MTTSTNQPSDTEGEFALGMRVQIQTGYADWHEGNIVDVCELSGEITVEDDDGIKWVGIEDHVERILEAEPEVVG